MRRKLLVTVLVVLLISNINAQVDSVDNQQMEPPRPVDTALRITNLNPFFSIHVDSTLSYQLSINKDQEGYYWYLKNSPVGLKINKDNGLLTFRAEKSYFLSGKLKYDTEYPVRLGVQSLSDPGDRIDTSFNLIFFNTEVVLPKIKPTVASNLVIEEGNKVSFRILCEAGNFPISEIMFTSSIPISDYKLVKACDDLFEWTAPYDFVNKETDSAGVKILNLNFIGSSRFRLRDTANVRIVVKDALNYPVALQEYELVLKNIRTYILQLKYTFLQLDKRLKKNKNARTAFDLTSATTALSGTILSTTGGEGGQTAGKILPSVGVALVPVKEATSPNKVVEQNQASLVRSSIKRLEYMLYDYSLVGEKDMAITTKTTKLKEELKQSQMQLIDVPVDITNNMTEEQLNNYFNSPKVNKKYRLSGK